MASLLASAATTTEEASALDSSAKFLEAASSFHAVLAMPPQEKLITYFSASYWHKRFSVPRQGWLYISDNHACFHANVMGRETRLVLPWTSVVRLEHKSRMLLADGVALGTRSDEHQFYLLSQHDEALDLMRQLATRAMRRMIDVEVMAKIDFGGAMPEEDGAPCATAFGRVSQRQQEVPSHELAGYFEVERRSEVYRLLFQLPEEEVLLHRQHAVIFDPCAAPPPRRNNVRPSAHPAPPGTTRSTSRGRFLCRSATCASFRTTTTAAQWCCPFARWKKPRRRARPVATPAAARPASAPTGSSSPPLPTM